MIKTTAKEIVNQAKFLANAKNSDFTDFAEITKLLNNEYRGLYNELISHSEDFLSSFTFNGNETELPSDCYQVQGVYSTFGNSTTPITKSPLYQDVDGCYKIVNNKISIIGSSGASSFLVRYSILPSTLTVPSDPVKCTNFPSNYTIDGMTEETVFVRTDYIWTDNSWEVASPSGLTITDFTAALDTDTVSWNISIGSLTRDSGTTPLLLGSILLSDGVNLWEPMSTQSHVLYTSPDDSNTYITVQPIWSADFEVIGLGLYLDGLTTEGDTLDLSSETFNIPVSLYYDTTVYNPNNQYYEYDIKTDVLTEVDEATYEEDVVHSETDTYLGKTITIDQANQTVTWNDKDISDYFIAYDDVTGEQLTWDSILVSSPYIFINYSNGEIYIMNGFDKTKYNIFISNGYDTLGEIVCFTTDDTTGMGAIMNSSSKNGKGYYYVSFVPDTVLSYPDSTFFQLLEARLAGVIASLLGITNEYLINELIPRYEEMFYRTMSKSEQGGRMKNVLSGF